MPTKHFDGKDIENLLNCKLTAFGTRKAIENTGNIKFRLILVDQIETQYRKGEADAGSYYDMNIADGSFARNVNVHEAISNGALTTNQQKVNALHQIKAKALQSIAFVVNTDRDLSKYLNDLYKILGKQEALNVHKL